MCIFMLLCERLATNITTHKTGPNNHTYSYTIGTNHAEPIIAGSGLDWPQQALRVRHEPLATVSAYTMVDT